MHLTNGREDAVGKDAELTFVFPCLNEERTLRICIQQIKKAFMTTDLGLVIMVADNGSTDGSREIAESEGCQVVFVPERGYGAALRAGIGAAASPYVMFADCDNTYLYKDAPALYHEAVKQNAGMAIASRMMGLIEPGAMPNLHRYLGTPVLTSLINLLFKGQLSDCNSGFRCVRKSEYEKWGIRSNGMEFASELLIKALKSGTKIVEITSGLKCGPLDRAAHLRTWRDGMRHLLFILSEKPALFEWSGILLTVVTTCLQLIAVSLGPVSLAGFHVFDLHSQALLLIGGIIGLQFYILPVAYFWLPRMPH